MRRFPTYTKIGFLMAGLLALGFLLPPISQADPNFTPEKVLKKVKPKSGKQRSPDSNLREVVGTLKYGDEDWKAVVEYIGQKDTVLQVEIDGGVAMKFREKTAFYERGTMATISHPIYKNPIIITVWEKGVGSKIVRIFYPSESLEPMQTLESPDENISFQVMADRVRIRYTDPKSITSGFSDKPPKQITVDWPPDVRPASGP